MTEPDFLKDYVDVAERITEFRAKHPHGSLQVSIVPVPEPWDTKFIAVEARAYRDPDDQRPGIDVAWEPVPGKTTYTKDSELMNCSTSAVGRAIVYVLAADTKRGIASKQEVANRQDVEVGPNGDAPKTGFASLKQRNFTERLLKDAGVPSEAQVEILSYMSETMTGERDGPISQAIDWLKDESKRDQAAEKLLTDARAYLAKQSDVPMDTAGLVAAADDAD